MKRILFVFILFIFFISSCNLSRVDDSINFFPKELRGVWVLEDDYIEGLEEFEYPIEEKDWFITIAEKEASITRGMVYILRSLQDSKMSLQLKSYQGSFVDENPNKDEILAVKYSFSYRVKGDSLYIDQSNVLFLFDRNYKRISHTTDKREAVTLPDRLIGVWDFDSYEKDYSYDEDFVNPSYTMTITRNEITVIDKKIAYPNLELIPIYCDDLELRLILKNSVGLSTGNYGFGYVISDNSMQMYRGDPYGIVISPAGDDCNWIKR